MREGLASHPFGDFYVWLLRASWPTLIGILASGYVLINLVFGVLFLLGGPCFGVPEPTLFDAVMFSVQTFATIGYGVMSPSTPWAHVLVATESFVGIVFAGMATGLMFARFSKPTARVAFAQNLLVTPRNGKPTLQIRIANQRQSEILQATVQVFVLIDETSPEGQRLRRFYPLRLERDTSPLFALSWTILHAIDETSPLFGVTAENLASRLVGIAVNVTGVDDSFGAQVYARNVYRTEDVVFGKRFADMMRPTADAMHIDHRKLSELVDLDGAAPRPGG